MKTMKLNFTVPEDVAMALKDRVGKRKRSAFVTVAVQEKLKKMEEEQLKQSLIEGYQARREEANTINDEWEVATLEAWPE